MTLESRLSFANDRNEWWKLRGIGASDVAAMLGLSPWRTMWDVWAERQPGVERIDRQTVSQRNGVRLEEHVIEDYEEFTDRTVDYGKLVVVRHEEFPWATCSPDGLVIEGNEYVGGLEAKTSSDPSEWKDGVPDYYMPQVLWSLEVTGLPWFDVAAWVARFGMPELVVHRVERDVVRQRKMLLEVARLRRRHLVDGVPPDVDTSPAARRFLNRNAPRAGEVRDATEREAELVLELAWHREQKKIAIAEVERIETELSLAFGDDTYGVRLDSVKCLRVRGRSADQVDLARVRVALPDAVRQGSEFFRFNLYPIKERSRGRH